MSESNSDPNMSTSDEKQDKPTHTDKPVEKVNPDNSDSPNSPNSSNSPNNTNCETDYEADYETDCKPDNKEIKNKRKMSTESTQSKLPVSDPISSLLNSFFQEIMKTSTEELKNVNIEDDLKMPNVEDELFKNIVPQDEKFFGFDIKYDPITRQMTCVINKDLITDPSFSKTDDSLDNRDQNDSKEPDEVDEVDGADGVDGVDGVDGADEPSDISDDEKESNTKKPKSSNLEKVKKVTKTVRSIVDFSSGVGDIEKLDEWLKSSDRASSDYSENSLDIASLNNKLGSLSWWLEKSKSDGLELKYTARAMDDASKLSHVKVLEWWFNSGLEMKYTPKAMDSAISNGKLFSLKWWISKSKLPDGKSLELKYTAEGFNKCRLEEFEILEIAKLFKSSDLEFKYGKEFIDYMGRFKYLKLHKYLMDNKMIKPTDILKIEPNIFGIPPKGNMINIMDLINGSRKTAKTKYNLEDFPPHIAKHIEDKEAELDNNMLVNGKAKEYIDSLIKIPFGKFRQEKIFKFMRDFIDKLNEEIKEFVESKTEVVEKSTELKDSDVEPSVELKPVELTNETDVIKFFKNDQLQNQYNKLYSQYKTYVQLRTKYLEYVDLVLNSTVFGHESTKKQFKCIIGQWLSGGLNTGVVIGVQGPPGVGKTSLIKSSLSKCLVDFIDYDFINYKIELCTDANNEPRPFSFISLGGSSNGSTLIGHNITYHGSTHGEIVKCLKQAKIMNPIIFFDELDKISKTENGNEISSVLTHITDPVQNEHFTDRYFNEVPIDLSKAIIVFSYNDQSRIDRILLDRIKEINVEALLLHEKVSISKQFLIPEIIKNIGYSKEDLVLTDQQIKTLVLEYTWEAGVRKLKEKIEEVIRNVHLDRLCSSGDQLIVPEISDEYIEKVMSSYHKFNFKKVNLQNKVGCINGMYATSNGLGDIMMIQIKKTYSKDTLAVITTGSLEKVISESMTVAKTVAWNLLTPSNKNMVINSYTNQGLHIHCPDGSTSKDGPSAGAAITCAIYSLFMNKPILSTISMTGEIDLDGNITAIGGLDAKLSGAKRAGVRIAFVPEENRRDIEILQRKNPELLDDTFRVEFLSHITQAITKIF